MDMGCKELIGNQNHLAPDEAAEISKLQALQGICPQHRPERKMLDLSRIQPSCAAEKSKPCPGTQLQELSHREGVIEMVWQVPSCMQVGEASLQSFASQEILLLHCRVVVIWVVMLEHHNPADAQQIRMSSQKD